VPQLIDRFLPRRPQTKLSLLVTALLILLVSLIGALFSDSAENLLREQIGRKALGVAQAVALNQQLRTALEAEDPTTVQRVAEEIRRITGAEFVVVGDRRGVRYSHPDPEKIGKTFVGGVPRGDNQDRTIGFVAVGYLIRDIETMIHDNQLEIAGYVAIVAQSQTVLAGSGVIINKGERRDIESILTLDDLRRVGGTDTTGG
jgi:sensor histidine kinase regulating citrate/malate metabolism